MHPCVLPWTAFLPWTSLSALDFLMSQVPGHLLWTCNTRDQGGSKVALDRPREEPLKFLLALDMHAIPGELMRWIACGGWCVDGLIDRSRPACLLACGGCVDGLIAPGLD